MPLTSHGITHTSLLLLLACAQGLNELGIIACLEHYPTIPVTAPFISSRRFMLKTEIISNNRLARRFSFINFVELIFGNTKVYYIFSDWRVGGGLLGDATFIIVHFNLKVSATPLP